ALAAVKFWGDWDYRGAETEFRRAIQLNSNFALAHDDYGIFLMEMGRFDEALIELKRAEELDSLSSYINFDLAAFYFNLRQYDRAIEYTEKALEPHPNDRFGHGFMGWCYLQK